ncbi:hypothetical protein [Aliivibrio fischeri]|uniref:hypothetical protein n=1 Tax=Aliivibrio fischeri TaxID=668 RepID=UPI0012D9BA6B|nr:hypothetical protein [Aliivibrio fischeri]MUK26982.1 hypothetical protein [Aliivibrio fischeri]MUK32620.1 hypothetical protein [Aliivibrio fischeri]
MNSYDNKTVNELLVDHLINIMEKNLIDITNNLNKITDKNDLIVKLRNDINSISFNFENIPLTKINKLQELKEEYLRTFERCNQGSPFTHTTLTIH